MHPSQRTCVDKIMSIEGVQTDGQTDDQGETNVPTKLNSFEGGGGMMMSILPGNDVH